MDTCHCLSGKAQRLPCRAKGRGNWIQVLSFWASRLGPLGLHFFRLEAWECERTQAGKPDGAEGHSGLSHVCHFTSLRLSHLLYHREAPAS